LLNLSKGRLDVIARERMRITFAMYDLSQKLAGLIAAA